MPPMGLSEMGSYVSCKKPGYKYWVSAEMESFSIPSDFWTFVFPQYFQTERAAPVSIPGWIFNSDMISCEHLFRPISKWFTEYSSIFMPRNIVVYSHAISPNAIPDAVAVARKLHSHGDPVDGLCRLLLCCPVRRTRVWWCWEEPRERGTN